MVKKTHEVPCPKYLAQGFVYASLNRKVTVLMFMFLEFMFLLHLEVSSNKPKLVFVEDIWPKVRLFFWIFGRFTQIKKMSFFHRVVYLMFPLS